MSGKAEEQCLKDLQAACKGLAIGKYCGMNMNTERLFFVRRCCAASAIAQVPPAPAPPIADSGAGYHDPRSAFKPLQEREGVVSWSLLSTVTAKTENARARADLSARGAGAERQDRQGAGLHAAARAGRKAEAFPALGVCPRPVRSACRLGPRAWSRCAQVDGSQVHRRRDHGAGSHWRCSRTTSTACSTASSTPSHRLDRSSGLRLRAPGARAPSAAPSRR